jgi:glycosyltransferase involved in cell wall biosynthesis
LRARCRDWNFPRQRPDIFGFSRGFAARIDALARAADVIHTHSMWNWPVYRAARAARRAGVPVIFRPAGALDRFDVQKRALAERVIGPLFLRRLLAPNVFHCTARREAEQLVAYGGDARREVLPLPVAAVACAGEEARASVRRRLGIPAEAPVVLFMSRLNYKKGLDLLPALARARAALPDLHFILAGAGEREIEALVDQLVKEHAMTAWTHRLGFVGGAEKAAMLAASDVFALPSQNENFGVSVVEALSAGLPVLVSPEVYIVGEIGATPAIDICAREIGALAAGVGSLLARVCAERPALAVEARAIWARHFSPAVVRPRYVDFYRRVRDDAQSP